MDTLNHITRAALRAASALAERDAKIRRAHNEGHSLRVIAKAAGLSHQRVHQIIDKR